jgi:hypothetical protein
MSALHEIEARLAAANSAADLHNPTYDGLTEHGGYSVHMGQGVSTDGYLPEEIADFIAHAPADLSALLAVVNAVREIHKEISLEDGTATCFHCLEVDNRMGEAVWNEEWPCPTVKAMADLLDGVS